jgi:hypothetical protein
MAKKLICYPFKDGNLLEYVWYNLDDSDEVQNGAIEVSPINRTRYINS